MVQPSGAVNASATLNDVELFNNSSGFTLNGSSSSGGTGNQAIIRNSVVSGSVGTGITVVSTAQGSSIAVHDTDVFNNAIGIQSNGNVTAVIVNGAYITRNVTGVTTANGGSVISFKNNSLQNNPAGNTFTASIDRN
jgi:hypothetical protein